ncbi:hypothetical protein GO308_11835 [Sphingomonas sp. SFZ2018-12]|uniref:hypothetical protein n=1 Tax=Sphingomonas sp. SFZ2018-12 TaxID=2683197 RepID=UPI001F0F3DC7|nr:hypothetical protein [Sphingomonas sp. SFZ2018-12]MCH4893803.1 hypothetical protein [Sphingomonas sp. SFZ2018-12]
MNKIPVYKCIGCIPQSRRQVGFYLPVFTNISLPGVFIQNTDLVELKISEFLKIEDDLSELIDLTGEFTANVGSDQIFVFYDGSRFNVGTLFEISGAVNKCRASGMAPALELEWAELYGLADQKRRGRERAASSLSNSQTSGGRAFLISMFLNSLWANITANRDPSTSRVDLARLHGQIMFDADPTRDTIFSDAVWIQLKPMLLLDRDQLRERVLRELPEEVLSDANDPVRGSEPGVNVQSLAEANMRLRRTGRQEERVGIILNELIERPAVGEFLLSQHHDRGRLAKMVLARVREKINSIPNSGAKEVFFASLVPLMFTNSFTFNRGELLFYLAKHLWKYKPIANAIRRKMSESQAYNVWQMQSSIERILDQSTLPPLADDSEPRLL